MVFLCGPSEKPVHGSEEKRYSIEGKNVYEYLSRDLTCNKNKVGVLAGMFCTRLQLFIPY